MNQILSGLSGAAVAAAVLLTCRATVAQPTPTAADVLRIRWVNPPAKVPPGVRHGTFHSDAMNTPVGYNIYLPPAYDAEPARRFPVVYFLHGSAGNESRSIGLSTYLGSAIAAGQVPPMLMVFANGGRGSGYIDSVDGTVRPETMIVQELIPYVDRTYRTVAERGGRAIEGFSMGGGGALRLAARHPDLFSSVVVYGAGGVREFDDLPTVDEIATANRPEEKLRIRKIVLGEDLEYWRETGTWYLLERNRDRIAGHLPIRIVIGTEDFSLDGAKVARDRLEQLKIGFEFELVEGVAHNIDQLYRRAGVAGLRLHAHNFSRPAGE